MKSNIIAAIGLASLMMLALNNDASGLSNPLSTGSNFIVNVATTQTQLAAVGASCSVTVTNLTSTPVYTGYAGVTTATGVPVCNDAAVCVSPWYVRDSVPAAIFAIWAGPLTTPIRVEAAGGCKSP